MKRRILLGLVVLVVVLALAAAYVALPVIGDLRAVRRTLVEQPLDDIERNDVRSAQARLRRARSRLDSIPGKVLGVLPVVGSNLNAVDALAEALDPVLETGLELKEAVDELAEDELVSNGKIRLREVKSLEGPLGREVEALRTLEAAVDEHMSGSLLPPVWDALSDLGHRVEGFAEDAHALDGILTSLDSLLGSDGKKTYLTLLLNNSELRAAGGVLTGIGTLTTENGKLKLGDFQSVHDLETVPLKRVPVPPDFERFQDFHANSTKFLNASASPDVPDVSLVAARLYKLVTGTKTDGAIVVDPRGLAALLPSGATLPTPKGLPSITAAELPEFVYSEAYEIFQDQRQRRNAILAVGRAAFETIVDRGLSGREVLRSAGRAIGAGHLRVVTFDDELQKPLEAAGATGDLQTPSSDALLVTAHNFGGAPGIGSKMDYWAERAVRHTCEIEDEDKASCVTGVTIRNIAPPGLDPYVTGSAEPYGLLRNYVEVFIPAEARITGVEKNDAPVRYAAPDQTGHTAVGIYMQEPPGDNETIEVGYDLDLDESYSLVATPQPLARDARIEIALRVPSDWVVRGPGKNGDDDVFRYEGPFEDTLEFSATPDRRRGLTALWDSLTEFWREPLF